MTMKAEKAQTEETENMKLNMNDFPDSLMDYAENHPDYSITQFEEKKYNTTHPIIGYYLATSWHLPPDICQLILRHHETGYLSELHDSHDQICFAVLKMAENLVHEERHHSQSRDWIFLRKAVLDVLGLTDYDYNDIKEDVEEIIFKHEVA